ncbi:MAG: hypothetical protein KDA73_04300 [Rhodobacteraceae bacterium]|nr:hypothetical protein [Paracoccaceae bacterium]
MNEDDVPLLSTPSLTALILHQAAAGPVTLDSLSAALDALFDTANVAPAASLDERRALLDNQLAELAVAGLLRQGEDGLRLTDRGQDALFRHPNGVDGSDLVAYPEYAAHVRRTESAPAGMDPRGSSYDEGYAARRSGQNFTANPYTLNTVDHQSWENGWMQALDDESVGGS